MPAAGHAQTHKHSTAALFARPFAYLFNRASRLNQCICECICVHALSKEEIEAIYHKPLVELIYDAATVHRMYHNPREVQQATLLSIKTGGCVETCSYCAQSSSWSKDTGLKAEKLMDLDDVYKGPHTNTYYTLYV